METNDILNTILKQQQEFQEELRNGFINVDEKFDNVHGAFTHMRRELGIVREEVTNLKDESTHVKSELGIVKEELH